MYECTITGQAINCLQIRTPPMDVSPDSCYSFLQKGRDCLSLWISSTHRPRQSNASLPVNSIRLQWALKELLLRALNFHLSERVSGRPLYDCLSNHRRNSVLTLWYSPSEIHSTICCISPCYCTSHIMLFPISMIRRYRSA